MTIVNVKTHTPTILLTCIIWWWQQYQTFNIVLRWYSIIHHLCPQTTGCVIQLLAFSPGGQWRFSSLVRRVFWIVWRSERRTSKLHVPQEQEQHVFSSVTYHLREPGQGSDMYSFILYSHKKLSWTIGLERSPLSSWPVWSSCILCKGYDRIPALPFSTFTFHTSQSRH